MPVEFSVAAYRFGHSMVRNDYLTNESHRTHHVFAPLFSGRGGAKPGDLSGLGPVDKRNVVQWDWFLKMTSSDTQSGFPQMARKIDTKLSNSLAYLKEKHPLNLLAYRNLKRGWASGLPPGTAMAKEFNITPLSLDKDEPDALWYYLLREAEAQGSTLGKFGSTIVCATFAGLLKGDPLSYFNRNPCWTPNNDPLLCPGKDNIDGEPIGEHRGWTFASIIRIAGLPADLREFEKQAQGRYPA
jgi:hypothetical protein